jgi:hypothetical protein
MFLIYQNSPYHLSIGPSGTELPYPPVTFIVAGGLLLFFFLPLLSITYIYLYDFIEYIELSCCDGGMLDPYCFREPRRAPLVSLLVILMGEGIGGERCASLAASDMIGGCSMTILLGVRERAI